MWLNEVFGVERRRLGVAKRLRSGQWLLRIHGIREQKTLDWRELQEKFSKTGGNCIKICRGVVAEAYFLLK